MLAIYTRLSKEDEESNSIKNQLREAEEYRKLNSITNFEIYNEGEGLSGTLRVKDRPELKRLIEDIESGKVTSIWMRKQNRLARLGITVLLFADAVTSNNVKLHFADKGDVDLSDPIEMFHLTIMAGVDALKPAEQSKQTKKALRDNAKEGKVWGVIPYGYRTDDNMFPYVDEAEAKVINRIFNQYLKGDGTKKIATSLNNDNIPTKYNNYENSTIRLKNKYTKKLTVKNTKDILWAEKTVKGILTNTWYIGHRIYSKETYETPKIVNETLFHKVQKAIQSRKGTRTSTPKYNYLLKGLLRCGKCGRNYYGRCRKSKNDNFYMCSSKRQASTNCGNSAISIPKLDSFILKHLFKDKQLLKQMELITSNNEVSDALKTKITIAEDKLKKETNRVNKYAKLLGEELEDDELIINEYSNSKKQVKQLKESLIKLNIQYRDLNNSEALNNYKKELKKTTLISGFNTLKTATNNIIENIQILSNKDKNNLQFYTILIEYKGLNETSTFYTKQPYNEWIYGMKLIEDEKETTISTQHNKIILEEEDIKEFN